MTTLLLEPDAGGRTTGGYLYNRKMAEHARSLRLVSVPEGMLQKALDAERDLDRGDLVLVDSLFFSQDSLADLQALRARFSVALGVVLHAFPSFIARASDRTQLARALPLGPTAEDLALLSTLDLVVTPGENLARLLGASGSDVPCLVCPPGVEGTPPPSSSGPDGSGDGAVRLIVLGNVSPAKGIADLLHALASITDVAYRLTIVGSTATHPEHAADLRALAARLGVAERTRLAGAMAHDRARGELFASEVLVLPSYTENCPLSVMEALSAGVPVVAYSVGDVPLLVEHDRSGLLAPVLDVEALSAALARVLRDAGERARLAAGARAAGKTLRSWADAALDFERALKGLSPS